MRKSSKKLCSCRSKKRFNIKKRYPSAQITYSASMDEYNQLLSNYDKIYDKVNIALVLCGTFFMVFATTLDLSTVSKWSEHSWCQKIIVILYLSLLVSSSVMMIISIIKLLLVSKGQHLTTFDSISIKRQALYEEKSEDTMLWITLQYLRGINDLRKQITRKQKRYNSAIIIIIIAVIIYVVSLFVSKMFL